MDGIEKGLYSLQNRKGALGIRLRFGQTATTIPSSSDTLIKLHRIMLLLKSSKLDDFLLAVHLDGIIDNEWERERFAFHQRHGTEFSIRFNKHWLIRIHKKGSNMCDGLDPWDF